MRPALLVLTLAVSLTGCMGHPERQSSIAPYGTGNVDEMRADLRACLSETMAFELIPDLGITANLHRNKCMRQRGWVAVGAAAGNALPDFSRPAVFVFVCPKGYSRNGSGCSTEVTAEPAWATGE